MLADSISIQIELIDNGFKYSTDGYTDDIKEWKYCYVPEGSKTVFLGEVERDIYKGRIKVRKSIKR